MITSIKISTLSKGIYLNGYEDKDFGANFLITGQVIKGVGRMPWHSEPMKDVISCDKLGAVARKL